MQLFKNVFGRIWAFWGLVTFVITFLIFYIPSMLCYAIPGNKGQKIFIDLSRYWMKIWLPLVGCPLKVYGYEHFKKNKAYIVTCNHNAFLDVTLSAPYTPGPNKTIAKNSFAKIPIFGWYYKKGSVLVDRKSERSRLHSFDEMKQVLKAGMNMCIFPEGTRNRTKEPLKQFYDGAFKLAEVTKSPIIPALIFNTRKAMPIHKTFYFWPHKLYMHFLPPVEADNLKTKELKDKVFEIMKNHYLKYENNPWEKPTYQ